MAERSHVLDKTVNDLDGHTEDDETLGPSGNDFAVPSTILRAD